MSSFNYLKLYTNNFNVTKDKVLNNSNSTKTNKLPLFKNLPSANSADVGNILFNKNDKKFYGFDGTEWISLSGSGSITSTLTNVGNGTFIYTGNSNSPFELRALRSSNINNLTIDYDEEGKSIVFDVKAGGGDIGGGLVNVGDSGAKIYTENLFPPFQLRRLTSTLGSVTITENVDTINFEAAGGGGGMTLLGSDIAVGLVNQLEVNAIPSTYNNMRVVFKGASNTSSGFDNIRLIINNDTFNNYYTINVGNFNGPFAADPGSFASNYIYAGLLTEGTGIPSVALHTIIEIPGYKDITFFKTCSVRALTLQVMNGIDNMFGGGVWMNTAAITSIKIITGSGAQITTNSGLYVYGY